MMRSVTYLKASHMLKKKHTLLERIFVSVVKGRLEERSERN